MDEIDFVAEHPKKDMSKVNRIIVNGKVYLAADKVLEIIDIETSDPSSGEDGDEPMSHAAGWMACGFLIKDKVLALKGGTE